MRVLNLFMVPFRPCKENYPVFIQGLKCIMAIRWKYFLRLLDKYHIDKVFANEDYEPYASERDECH